MDIKAKSYFRDPVSDQTLFENWVKELEKVNGREYERIDLQTSLGKTQVWALHTATDHQNALVIFPGARTTSLIWDFDRGLDELDLHIPVYMVETNGLPNLSDGNTPDIKSEGYGFWAGEVLNLLGLESAFIAGASFGGLVGMKLAIVHPEKVKAAFLLNPGCMQPFSMKLKNLYYNLLPLIHPTRKNISKFLERAIFSEPHHQLSAFAKEMLIGYEEFAIKRYKDHTQKPYYMGKALERANVDTYLLLGDHDLLFPFEKSIKNAKQLLPRLKEIKVFDNVGHGIETYNQAIRFIGDKIKNY